MLTHIHAFAGMQLSLHVHVAPRMLCTQPAADFSLSHHIYAAGIHGVGAEGRPKEILLRRPLSRGQSGGTYPPKPLPSIVSGNTQIV